MAATVQTGGEIGQPSEAYEGAYEGYGGRPSQWGNPQAAEKKKPPKRDFLDNMFTYVNYDLLVSKTFYFFFFAAFGSLFPLIAVYFKQIGMNPTQSGILIGFRPFVEFFSAPFWGSLADKWKKGKQMLLFSLVSWICFTLALAFVKPEPTACLAHNTTTVVLVPPWTNLQEQNEMSTKELRYGDANSAVEMDPFNLEYKIDHMEDTVRHPKVLEYGISPLPLNHLNIANAEEDEVSGLVSPPFSSIVYRSSDIHSVFFILLFLIIVGEFFSAPAIALADSATLGYLYDDVENYGRQRMLGSLGWGLSMFFVGIALDQADVFSDHPCGYKQKVERNYTVCFAVFTVLMCCAFLAATQFRFYYDGFAKEAFSMKDIKAFGKNVASKVQKKMDETKGWGKKQFEEENNGEVYKGDGLVDPNRKVEISMGEEKEKSGNMVSDSIQQPSDVVTKPSPFIPRGKPGQSGTMPEWLSVIKMFGTIKYGSLLYLTWFMGFGVGLVFTFLFWHLQDLKGTPTLFGIASVINHVSEIFAYFFSKKLINSIGHIRVLYIGLIGNIGRFIYISYLPNPWWVLPFEFVQGLTHAAVWAALCSYITQATPGNQRATAQGILQGIHHGLGRGCGAVIGGVLIYYFGSENVFRGYGIACIIVLVAYFALNFFYISKLPPDDRDADKDTTEFLEETSHLAPCGVPMSISRNLSSSKLDDLAKDGTAYGATTNGYLDPGNPRPVHVGYDQEDGTARDKYSYNLPENIGRSAQPRLVMQDGPAPGMEPHMQQPMDQSYPAQQQQQQYPPQQMGGGRGDYQQDAGGYPQEGQQGYSQQARGYPQGGQEGYSQQQQQQQGQYEQQPRPRRQPQPAQPQGDPTKMAGYGY